MPNLPKPLQIIDYKKLAIQFDNTVFDFNAKEKFWPMVWLDSSKKNYQASRLPRLQWSPKTPVFSGFTFSLYPH